MKKLQLMQGFGLLAGFSGLLMGLLLLDQEPLFGVLAMLGSMALLLESLARVQDGGSKQEISFRTRLQRRNTDGREF
ncbi:MAG TPA: hypothetical protein VJQ54_12485 [Candidatus Sulfotelmatobacter sp.]|nr:hypothetical protein [Candidatus Sulfotelmatobacter sp.]